MTIVDLIILVLALAGLILLVAAVVRVVRGDGYGHRPAPLSHLPWNHSLG